MSGKRGAEGGSRISTALAPGDRLRGWWDGLSRVQKWGFGILLFGALALLPLYTPPFLDTPGISFGGTMAQFAMVAIIAIGLNVVVGQAGLLDLGYVGFYAVGAYTVALLTSPDSPWNQTGPDGWLSKDWASARRRCDCAATTWRSSHSDSARSSDCWPTISRRSPAADAGFPRWLIPGSASPRSFHSGSFRRAMSAKP